MVGTVIKEEGKERATGVKERTRGWESAWEMLRTKPDASALFANSLSFFLVPPLGPGSLVRHRHTTESDTGSLDQRAIQTLLQILILCPLSELEP